ncbi:MAG: site-2 protease family protein [Deltaproteobacteria bacterium]|nr:site-2 protease family protein [Deltaproteobacteria bacterium]
MPPGEGGGLILGDSLLSWLLTRLLLGPLPETAAVIIHPVAFAGWIGLFITCLNLIPIGQLDGGHVMYALLGPRHRLVSRACLGLLVAWGAYGLLSGEGWPGWLLWGVLLMALGVGHPHPLDPLTPLDSRRRAIGWLTVLVFIATFVPVPFKI